MRSCSDCVCRRCMRWWQQMCPHGGCFDDLRAREDPWKGPERRTWSDWNKPGEQAHWCRGGNFYPVESCGEFAEYQKPVVTDCLSAVIQKWADGTIQCSILDSIGCSECMRRFEERMEEG